jgi:hypothetical protein
MGKIVFKFNVMTLISQKKNLMVVKMIITNEWGSTSIIAAPFVGDMTWAGM